MASASARRSRLAKAVPVRKILLRELLECIQQIFLFFLQVKETNNKKDSKYIDTQGTHNKQSVI